MELTLSNIITIGFILALCIYSFYLNNIEVDVKETIRVNGNSYLITDEIDSCYILDGEYIIDKRLKK